MGMYMFVSEEDRITKRKVSDPHVNEEFQEALKYHPLLMIEEKEHLKKSLFGRTEVEVTYQIYHETPAWDGLPYQARYQISGSGPKAIVIAYLHGIINGAVHQQSINKLLGK